jgi:hypothetical protein
MTITLGWWLLPLAITIGAFLHFHRIWVRGVQDGLGQAIATVFAVFAAINVSLIAWLVWALIGWGIAQ